MDFLTDIGALGGFLGTSLRLAIPIAFAALGGVMAERSGVYNIGLEGMMLLGAFGAAAGALATDSAIGGLMFRLVCGAMGGLTLAVLSVSLAVNQIVCGITVNILAAGLTSFLARLLFGIGSGARSVAGFERLPIPVLSEIPVIGPALFDQHALAYLLYLIVPLLFWMIFYTPWGLAIRAAGERPIAVESAGIPVARIRYACVLASGALAGAGGCYLVLAEVFTFTENMTAGKGFVGLAALILGRWNPAGALMAALLFGLCDSLQLHLQFANPDVPYQIFIALPYVVSILALLGFYGRIHPPAALGDPYRRESA